MNRRIAVLIAAALLSATSASAQRSAAQIEQVPASSVTNGVPQGIFFSRSLLSGRTVCLLFLSGGRVSRFVPSGGLENFDWARHNQAHGPDSGRWEVVAGGEIRIVWGDGGVHQGKLTVHSDGIEFYGKRYTRPSTVTLADMVGRWEAARGGAMIGGEGVNRVSTLVIRADGRYELGVVTGGVVAGRATSAATDNIGRVTISGLTMTLRSEGGRITSHTFLPAAGSPVSAFTLDADMFTRVDQHQHQHQH